VSFLTDFFGQLPQPIAGLIGHRGLAGRAPENTLAAFKAAAQAGLNWVEFDTQACATGEWVVFHDKTLERTTNGRGLIQETPYENLKTLDAGSWFNAQFKNERIPTLKDTLAYLANLKLHPNIEIKTFHEINNNQIANFLQTIQVAWPNTLPPPLVSSFDLKTLEILRSLDQQLPLGYIVEHPTEETLDLILDTKLDSLHCDHRNLLPTLLTTSILKSIPLLAYTVNNQAQLETLLQAGVTAVFSDLTNDIHL
jgi:glycerophosphoryl diester phosphodiesterase